MKLTPVASGTAVAARMAQAARIEQIAIGWVVGGIARRIEFSFG